MSKIEEIIYADDNELSKYEEILYNLDFIEEILGIEPQNILLTDESRMWHFGFDEAEIKHKLFYKYGYELLDINEKLVDVLKQIRSNILKGLPQDHHAFWAIPSRLCISHSHPARDVFKQEELSKSILACNYDVIIELRTFERDTDSKNYNLFDELNGNNKCLRIQEIIPENIELSYYTIQKLIDKIDLFIANGAKVLIHSQGKTDRLALILACWLVKNKLADKTNFIDKIAQLRLGLWAKGDEDIYDKYIDVKLNKTLRWVTDETRPFIPNTMNKVRKLMTVPFLFNKELIKLTKYWEYGVLPINYEVDEEIYELIEKFKPIDNITNTSATKNTNVKHIIVETDKDII